MSERRPGALRGSFSVARPGYAGSKEGHSLFVREDIEGSPRKPGIVLFDEVEKAHPVVLRALLHVLDSGVMRLSAGTSRSTSATVSHIHDIESQAGIDSRNQPKTFSDATFAVEDRNRGEALLSDPEFLNRIDEIIEFDPISPAVAAEIVDIEIDRIIGNVARRVFVSPCLTACDAGSPTPGSIDISARVPCTGPYAHSYSHPSPRRSAPRTPCDRRRAGAERCNHLSPRRCRRAPRGGMHQKNRAVITETLW